MNTNNNNYLKKISLICTALLLLGTVYAQSLADSEIKRNITSISSPLQKLVMLEPKSYEYETAKFKYLKLQHGRKYGFLAENVQGIFPELVGERSVQYMFGKNSYRDATIKTVDETALVPLLVAAIKEQQLQIEALKAAVAELKSGQK